MKFFSYFSSTVDEAAMRSVAILLKALPLQPDCVDQDITEAKSELFLKYVLLFFYDFLFTFIAIAFLLI